MATTISSLLLLTLISIYPSSTSPSLREACKYEGRQAICTRALPADGQIDSFILNVTSCDVNAQRLFPQAAVNCDVC